MNKKDPNYVAKLEKAISEKYGTSTVSNPRSGWDDEKEKIHQAQIERIRKKQDFLDELNEKVEVNGVFIPKKLFNNGRQNRTCPVCDIYSFTVKDDLYMNRHNCCFLCYVKNIEHRKNKENK